MMERFTQLFWGFHKKLFFLTYSSNYSEYATEQLSLPFLKINIKNRSGRRQSISQIYSSNYSEYTSLIGLLLTKADEDKQ